MFGRVLGRPLFALKISPSHVDAWFLGPTRVHITNDISIGSAVLQGSQSLQTDTQTDRQTDRQTTLVCYSVCSNICIHLVLIMRAHWHHLANTTELVFSSVHPSLQPKRQMDRFSRFCTAHGRKSLYLTMRAPIPQIAAFHGDLDPYLTHDSLGPSEPKTQMVCRSVQPFLHR